MAVPALDDDIVLFRLHGIQPEQIYRQACLNAPKPFNPRFQSDKADSHYIEGIAPIPIGLITELCGPACSGKTQACLSFTVDTFMSTSNKILFIDTENSFSTERLLQILSARYHGSIISDEQLKLFTNAVLVLKGFTSDTLLERLANLDELVVSESISCLIVDSIAATCRSHLLTDCKKNEYLSGCATQLKYLADKYRLSCLVTNQVVGNYQTSNSLLATVRPALGLQWSHAVNVRYVLEPIPGSISSGRLRVSKSPHSVFSVEYKITEAGVIPKTADI